MVIAEGGVFPRSGLWDLHSKKDGRWNLQGQYGGEAPQSPPALLPPEAREALDGLAAALGEEPPDDLVCVTRPYPSPGLRRLFEAHVLPATERQGTLHVLTEELGLTSLNMDLDRGEVSFARPGQGPAHRFPTQFLGLLSPERACWQWGWVAVEAGSMSPAVLKAAREVRDFGQRQSVPELTCAELALGTGDDRPWFDGDYLATVACPVISADFSIAAPAPDAPGILTYWAVTAPDVLPKPASEAVRLAYVIKEAMARWADALRGSDGRRVVRAYADPKRWAVTEVSPRRLRLDAPGGDHLFIDFDEAGGIYGVELPPRAGPGSGKASWLGRLLGKKGGA